MKQMYISHKINEKITNKNLLLRKAKGRLISNHPTLFLGPFLSDLPQVSGNRWKSFDSKWQNIYLILLREFTFST